MSGYYNYYLQCDNCGLIGPQLSLVRNFPSRQEYLLPSADLKTGEFIGMEVTIENRKQLDQLPQLAAMLSSALRPVSIGLLRDHKILLTPPLPCPKCGNIINNGCTKSQRPVAIQFHLVADIIEATRGKVFTGHRQFVSEAKDICIDCIRDNDKGIFTNQWTVRRRVDTGDVNTVVEQLMMQLMEIGSRCSSPKLSIRQGRFIEWLEG